MSGGRFNYQDGALKSEIFGYYFNKQECVPNVFEDREISELVWDVLDLIHDYDWYASGDTSKQDYLDSKDAFKEKWFKNRKAVDKAIVDKAVKELKSDLYESFGYGSVGNEID